VAEVTVGSTDRPLAVPVPRACVLAGCAKASAWVPRFSLRPPEALGYTGKPLEATPVVGICDSHRAWFLEVGFREWLAGIHGQAASMGIAVDPARTTCELIQIGAAPADKRPGLAEHLL
jgi:hypothetical protein